LSAVAKVAVFIDYDIVLRHFLLSGGLPALEAEHEVVWVFPTRHCRVTTDPATLPLGRYRPVTGGCVRGADHGRVVEAAIADLGSAPLSGIRREA